MFSFARLRGEDARNYAPQLAELRLKVFSEFPYLYEGTIDYEMKYLETYFKAKNAFVFLVLDAEKVVGATTAIWANEEEESFKKPFETSGFSPAEIFYFGESVLLKEYRNQGVGKLFFAEREAFAASLPMIRYTSFCAVERSQSHLQRPEAYRPLDEFWKAQGYEKIPGLTTRYSWRDRGDDSESEKIMQFWMKKIR